MLSRVLYVVMNCSGTSVRSIRKRPGANPPAVATMSKETLRRPRNRLLRQRQISEMFPLAATGVVLWHLYVVNQMCLLLRTTGGQEVAIETVLPEIGLFVSSTGNLNIVTLVHMEKLSTMRSLETPVI